MKYVIFSFFVILLYFTQRFGNTVEIKILAFNYEESMVYNKTEVEKEFSEYAKNNNFDITIDLEVLVYEKPTDAYSYFKSLVESLLNKNNSPYDMYFYDSKYTDIYSPYLLNLKDNVPEEFLEKFDSKIISEICTSEDKVVGLPFGISYELLYSNKILLSKYNKPVPKTWDELIKTCKYIMDKENDSDLICYNGLFDDSEQGLFSLYEFIYSCRDSYNSTYPNPQDPSFKKALNIMKNLKNQVDSGGIFNSNENFTFRKLMNGEAIFIKYWFVGEPLLG